MIGRNTLKNADSLSRSVKYIEPPATAIIIMKAINVGSIFSTKVGADVGSTVAFIAKGLVIYFGQLYLVFKLGNDRSVI